MSSSEGRGRDSDGGRGHKSKDSRQNIGWALTGGVVIGAIASLLSYLGYKEYEKCQQQNNGSYESKSGSAPKRAPPEPSIECCICRETLSAPLEILPCDHIFHKQCIKDWFKRRMDCPVCRQRISDQFIAKYNERLGL